MKTAVLSAFGPRKTPVQERAGVTVEAIQEATVQILLDVGAQRLTTTRVAARAGVSVGTLYQNYPNKQALLYAVLEQHMTRLTEAVEQACATHRHEPLAVMAKALVETFVDAKMERPETSAALYSIAADLNGAALVKVMNDRGRKAARSMLRTTPDARFELVDFTVQMLFAAMAGATRAGAGGRTHAGDGRDAATGADDAVRELPGGERYSSALTVNLRLDCA